MLNCHNATRLNSQAQDGTLPVIRQCALKLHLLTCPGCRNFLHHLDDLRSVARAFTRRDGSDPGNR